MSRVNLLNEVVADLEELSKSLKEFVAAMDDIPIAKDKIIPIEKVRALLAEKSQGGKQPEVKALIQKYGAKKLTEIDPVNYADLMKDAEALI